jgi:Ca2+-dependent lipid-binding protein
MSALIYDYYLTVYKINMPLSSEEIQKRRALISKLKEETMSHDEAQELISLLEKEKCMLLEEEGGDSC